LLIRKCDEGIDHNEAKKYLQYIVDNAERLNYLTQQIEEMGDLKRVNLAAYSITKFMQEQESTFIAAASQFNKKLQLNIESEKNYTIYIDYDKLRFAITQIIEFVAEHTQAENKVLHSYGTSYE
jgi:nitrogen-specific signal transduction histidine kinase